MTDFFDRSLTPDSDDTAESAEPRIADGTSANNRASTDATATAPDSALPSTPASLKSAIQDLLRYGLIERSAKPNLYRALSAAPTQVTQILEPLDLLLRTDDLRGIAFLAVPDPADESQEDAWQHPLVRRQRLTTEQSLLVALLRQAHIAFEQQYGIGAAGALIDLDELQAQFDLYLGPTGSESRDRDRLLRVVTQLHAHGIVSEPDRNQQITIRPIIVHLANPGHLQLLLNHFQSLATPPVPETTVDPTDVDSTEADES